MTYRPPRDHAEREEPADHDSHIYWASDPDSNAWRAGQDAYEAQIGWGRDDC